MHCHRCQCVWCYKFLHVFIHKCCVNDAVNAKFHSAKRLPMVCVSLRARIECKRWPKRHQSLLDKSNDPNKRNSIYDSSSTNAEQNTDEAKSKAKKKNNIENRKQSAPHSSAQRNEKRVFVVEIKRQQVRVCTSHEFVS